MNDFTREGFLTKNPCNIEAAINREHADSLSVSTDINCFAQSYQYQLSPNNSNQVELLASALYARCLSTYQGIILLANTGMKHQSNMLLRCMLESVFQLKALSNDPDFIELLKMQGLRTKREAFNRLVKMKNRNKQQDDFYQEALKNRRIARKEVNKKRNGHNSGELSVITTAKKAGMEDYYDTIYALGSSAIHSGLHSIEEHFVVNTENLVKELINQPSIDDYSHTLLASNDLIIISIKAMDTIFERPVNQEVANLEHQLREVFQNPPSFGN